MTTRSSRFFYLLSLASIVLSTNILQCSGDEYSMVTTWVQSSDPTCSTNSETYSGQWSTVESTGGWTSECVEMSGGYYVSSFCYPQDGTSAQTLYTLAYYSDLNTCQNSFSSQYFGSGAIGLVYGMIEDGCKAVSSLLSSSGNVSGIYVMVESCEEPKSARHLSPGAIAGIVIGSFVGLLILIILLIICCRKRRSNQQQQQRQQQNRAVGQPRSAGLSPVSKEVQLGQSVAAVPQITPYPHQQPSVPQVYAYPSQPQSQHYPHYPYSIQPLHGQPQYPSMGMGGVPPGGIQMSSPFPQAPSGYSFVPIPYGSGVASSHHPHSQPPVMIHPGPPLSSDVSCSRSVPGPPIDPMDVNVNLVSNVVPHVDEGDGGFQVVASVEGTTGPLPSVPAIAIVSPSVSILPPAAFCSQCGVRRPSLEAKFCSQCGAHYNY